MDSQDALEEERKIAVEGETVLYRYQPTANERIDKLDDENIFFSNPINFNDLEDIRIPVRDRTGQSPFSKESLVAALKILTDANPSYHSHWFYTPEVTEKLEALINDMAAEKWLDLSECIEDRAFECEVVCLTPDHLNPLMWAHYAGSHSGFCTETNANSADTRHGSLLAIID